MIMNNPMKNTPLTFKFYEACPQLPDRNAIIDDLESWLSYYNPVATIVSNNPFELSMTQFKLNASDSNAFIISAQIQYMSVTWNTYYHAYYWIRKITRSSNDVITLDIELDFLNTLHNGDTILGSPLYTFSPLSSIEREHVDRFVGTGLSIGTNHVSPLVDPINEESNVKLFHEDDETDKNVKPQSNTTDYKLDSLNWYLVYASSGEQSGARIRCFLIPETSGDIKLKVGTDPAKSICNMSMVHRDSPLINKIIRCPYCPVDPERVSGDVFTFDRFTAIPTPTGGIFFDTLVDYYNVLSMDLATDGNIAELQAFERNLQGYLNASFDLRTTIEFSDTDTSLNQLRTIEDTKLLSSEFYGVFFVYDSSIWQLKVENFTNTYTTEILTKIIYNQSSSIDSALTFSFDFDPSNYLDDNYYTCILASSRQSEVVVYSDDYMDYIKTGYNYDKKKQAINSAISIGSSAVALGASLFTGNALGAVGSSLSLAKSITGSITAELDMQKGLSQLANKTYNVSGINDSTLFRAYGDYKLKRIIMKPRENERTRWNDIFYYYGYNRSGVMKLPDVMSRVWFNYLKGEIVLGSANYLPLWLYEKVKAKFREGVTYYHCQKINGYKSWDLAQTKENYETFLLDL